MLGMPGWRVSLALAKGPPLLLLLLLFLQSCHPGLPPASNSKHRGCKQLQNSPDFVLLGNSGDGHLCLHLCLQGRVCCQHPLRQPGLQGSVACAVASTDCCRLQTLGLISLLCYLAADLEDHSLFFLTGVIFADHQLSPTSVLHNLLARFKKRSCIKCV